MSGYNPDTGIFELTSTKAQSWFRRNIDELPDGIANSFRVDGFWPGIIALFAHYGIRAEAGKGGGFCRVWAKQSQIWEILSGTPSTTDYEYLDPVYLRRKNSRG